MSEDGEPTTPMVKVGVLDDHRAFADALCMAVNATDDLECVGIAGSMEACLDLATATQPGVLVVDYRLIDGDGLSCVRQLKSAGVTGNFIMLTAHASEDLAELARAAGVSAFLPKEAPLKDVLDMIRSVSTASAVSPARTVQDGTALSRRQREVLELMGAGFGPADIADQLFISIHTARGHVKDLLRTFDASSQLEAVATALRRGFLIPPRVENERDN
jgi:DNA-binding NarL/FixJ family response regulator